MKRIFLALLCAACMPIMFATSGSSGIEEAEAYLKKTYPMLNWQKGMLMNNY